MPNTTTQTITIPVTIPTIEDLVPELHRINAQKKTVNAAYEQLRQQILTALFAQDPTGTDRTLRIGAYRVKHTWRPAKEVAKMFQDDDLAAYLAAKGLTQALQMVPKPNYVVIESLITDGVLTEEELRPFLRKPPEFLEVVPV